MVLSPDLASGGFGPKIVFQVVGIARVNVGGIAVIWEKVMSTWVSLNLEERKARLQLIRAWFRILSFHFLTLSA